MVAQYALSDQVRMKKTHPCGSDLFEIIRVGADIKIKCLGCGHIVMMSRKDFEKRAKALIKPVEEQESGTEEKR